MRKSFTIAKVLLSFLCMLGAGLTASAASSTQITLGEPFTVTGSAWYYYTPSESGVLTVHSDSGNSGFLYPASQVNAATEDVDGSSIAPSEEIYDNAPDFVFKFDVKGGTTYYFLTYYGELNLTATIEGGGSGPAEDLTGFSPMEMTRYSGISSSNPLKLYYTPKESGILTVVQTGTFDGMLFDTTNIDASSTTAYNHVVKTVDGGYTGTNPYTLVYSLGEGETVYYMTPNALTGSVSAVEFKWESTNIPTIEVDEPFSSFEEVMEFTPAYDGILTVSVNTYYRFQWDAQSGGLLFTSPSHSQLTALSFVVMDDGDNSGTCVMKFTVNGGQKYYFWNPVDLNGAKFTFSLAELGVPTLADVEPTPGLTFDAQVNYASGVKLTFDPLDVTFDKAYVIYTPTDGTEVTEELTTNEAGNYGTGYFHNPNGTYNFGGVSIAYLKAEKGSTVTLKLTNANYNGVVVSETLFTDNQYITVDEGNITISWKVASEPIELVSTKSPATIYQSSTKGDLSMVVELTFNENIMSKPVASFTFGHFNGTTGENPDPSSSDAEIEIPVTVEGPTVYVDLSGINFGEVYSMGTKAYKEVTLLVSNIIGEDGQEFWTGNIPASVTYINYVNEPNPNVTVTYMEDPTMLYDSGMKSAILYWNEPIFENVPGETLTADVVGPNGENSTVSLYITIYEPNRDAEPGEGMQVENALVAPVGQLISEMGSGEYTISIGTLVKNATGAVNKAFSGKFTVMAPPTLVDDYEFSYDGENTITVTWNGEISEYNEEESAVFISGENYVPYYQLSVGEGVTISGNSVKISLAGLDLEEGAEYNLAIPENFFYIGANKDAANGTVDEYFVYGESENSGGTEPDPNEMAAGAVFFEPDPSMPTLFIYWEEEIEPVAAELTGTLVTPNESEVEVTFIISTYLPGVEEGTIPEYNENALCLPMSQYIAQYGAGNYQISIPAGIVSSKNTGKLNPAMTEDSFFVAQEPTLSDAEPVINYNIEANTITIVWDDLEVSEYNPNDGTINILNNYDADFEDIRLEIGKGVVINGDMVTVNLEGLGLVEGVEYQLSIAAYYFYLGENNEANDAIEYSFVYGDKGSGVNYLEAEAVKGGIYNLNGVKIDSEVKDLQNGIYIINGKKVMIRK